MRVQEDAETPLMTEGSLPPPPNAFTEAEALRWPSIRAALSEETGARVGQGLAVRVVRGYDGASDTPPKIAQVLEKTVAWRQEYAVDAMLTAPAPAWEVYQALWPCYVHGPDADNRLIVVERFGSMDVLKIVDEVSRDDMRRNRAQTLEVLDALQARAAAKAGTPDVTERIHVFDLSGLKRRHLGLKVPSAISDMVGICLDHYPGAMNTLYVTNTPFVFQIVWKMVKPMLPAKVLARVHLCGKAHEFMPKMITAGCPLASIPVWMAASKLKLRGQHEGTAVVEYVRALSTGTSSLPSETSLRLRRATDDSSALDGAATATILKRGLACKRGRRTGAVNRKPVELILYKPGRLAWSRGGGSVTSVGVARCELRRPGSHTFVVETPFGHERSFRCERAADAEAWVTEVKAVLTTASSDFRPEDFAAAHVPRWRRYLRNTLFHAAWAVVFATLVYLTHWLQWRVLKMSLVLYVISLVCGLFNPIEALLRRNPRLIGT